MTIAQRKISLINWITNLQDEKLLSKIENFRNLSLDELPSEIVELLQLADTESPDHGMKHTNSRDILNR
ncbi:hypothetical protein [Reichenbachiella versicolor]|uniref:hypothetical protein n=1 Tax=Reichenbachiella versicolor TaxID=1821036 RepID=UPI000D6E8FEC|nr:hypothetical protein [Reichenbachiella versicolor]